MSTYKKIVIMVISVIFLFLAVMMGVIAVRYNNLKKVKLNELSQYLTEHYSENMVVERFSMLEYTAVCYPLDNPELTFVVFDSKTDTYLENCLRDEAGKLIQDRWKDKYPDIRCSIFIKGSSIELRDRLYSLYKQLSRPLSWYDEECNETVYYITINVNDEFIDENDANEMVNSIDEMPINCIGHIAVEDANDNVIVDVIKES